ncbi:MAG: alpha/beta fold hydrolase [Spirochaetales bacterium]|nr:alpha/beta fold hydrolase [Spirochaetales bacterium]
MDVKNRTIPCYAYGEGPVVLMCHGWGSRAGHLAPMARLIARKGFRTVLFDAPGHSSTMVVPEPQTSSMFEFALALTAVASRLGSIDTIIGHSLGAMSALFTLTKRRHLKHLDLNSKKLVLISTPARFSLTLQSFGAHHRLTAEDQTALRKDLEHSYDMKVDEYDCLEALDELPLPHLVVQDEEDEYFSPDQTLLAAPPKADRRVFRTLGFGHDRILLHRDAARAIGEFIQTYNS